MKALRDAQYSHALTKVLGLQPQALLNAPDIRGLPTRAIIEYRAARPCAARRSAVAARTDGRYSGGFTPGATVGARHVNAPELSA